VYALLFTGALSSGYIQLHVVHSDSLQQYLGSAPQPRISEVMLNLYARRQQRLSVDRSSATEQQVRVDIYQSIEPASPSTDRPARRLLASSTITIRRPAWHRFKLDDQLISSWLEYPSTNISLQVELSEPMIRFSLGGSGPRAPHLSVYTDDSTPHHHRRRRRRRLQHYTTHVTGPSDCQQNDGEKRCCRYPIWISFKDIGWDSWVVQPDGYQAYYCDGRCPPSYKLAHNFSAIKALIHLANPAALPSACCVASKLSALTLLHYNTKGHLVVTIYEDMVVERCRCA